MAEQTREPTPVDFVALKKKHKLTAKQIAFIQEFLLSFNATKAAKAASEYSSDASASRAGYGFLHRENVAAALTDILAERNKTWSTDHERIVQTAMAMAYSDLGDFIEWDEDGIPKKFKATKDIPKHKRTALRSIRHRVYKDGGYSTEVTLKPSGQALELLMKHKGMLTFQDESLQTKSQIAKWFEQEEQEFKAGQEAAELRAENAALRQRLAKLEGQSDDDSDETETGEDV